jgi:hypothetical protein
VAVLGDSMRHPVCSFAWRGLVLLGSVCAHRPQRLLTGITFGNIDDECSFQLASFSVELLRSRGDDISGISMSRKPRLSSDDSASFCNRSNLSR